MGQFLSAPLLRHVLAQPKSAINIQEIMDSGKILLVNLSKGRIGEDSSALLGAMIISSLHFAAMRRVAQPEAERRPFFVYADEFQSFATSTFASLPPCLAKVRPAPACSLRTVLLARPQIVVY